MQDAYVSETGVTIGNWKAIGYNMASSSNFTYAEPSTGFTNNTVALSSGMEDAWTATSLAPLNDCPSGAAWTISVEQNGSTGGSALYDAAIDNASSKKNDCEVLAPSFVKLDTKDKAL